MLAEHYAWVSNLILISALPLFAAICWLVINFDRRPKQHSRDST